MAVQEERLSGVKRDRVFLGREALCVRYCLQAAGLEPEQLTAIGVSSQTGLRHALSDLRTSPLLADLAAGVPVLPVSHHLAHAVSSYALSGFDSADVLVIDGLGGPFEDCSPMEQESIVGWPGGWESVSMYHATARELRPTAKFMVSTPEWVSPRRNGMRRFATVGGLYSAVAEQIFGDLMEAGKVMGLAPLGQPTIPITEFLSPGMPLEFTATVADRFAHDDRWPMRQEEYANLAASSQRALEHAVLSLMAELRRRSPSPREQRMCYAGGVALNVIANEAMIERGTYRDTFITPAAEDSGAAVGAAYAALWSLRDRTAWTRRRLARDSAGSAYRSSSVRSALADLPGLRSRRCRDAIGETCDRLEAGEVVGWFSGGSELGPRALGQRSILCDPRSAEVRDRLNAEIKRRELFRPFAPVLPRERAHEWLCVSPEFDSPFMLRIAGVREDRATVIPAVVHVDGTTRPQTVCEESHPRLSALLSRWEERTGVPVLLNTSFNLSGEPIVETPREAALALLASGLDACFIESWAVTRSSQSATLLDFDVSSSARRVSNPVGSDGDPNFVAYGVRTPWGPTVIGVHRSVAPLIDAAIAEPGPASELAASQWPAVADSERCAALHRLIRMRLLDLGGIRSPTRHARATTALVGRQ